jgi:hypothetical protein
MEATTILGRQRQLDVLAYGLVLILLAALVMTTYALIAHVDVANVLLLHDRTVAILVIGLLTVFLAYMADQQRRLRTALKEREGELLSARDELAGSYDRISFAHHALEIMSKEPYGTGLNQLLQESARHFDGDAAAIVGREVAVFSEPGVDEDAVMGDILPISIQCVSGSQPVSVGSQPGGGTVIAVPLRVQGCLDHVFCIWREAGAFGSDKLEGLMLVARIIELSSENRTLTYEMAEQAIC